MRRAELALRKELALTHLRIARAELALARSEGPSTSAAFVATLDLGSWLLSRVRMGAFGRYARMGLSLVRLLTGSRAASGPLPPAPEPPRKRHSKANRRKAPEPSGVPDASA